ncbi:MAG TPA: DUF1499 domain-containing protein [Chitinivibrionales bacterium]|nr:DUF1499 domain-containing protein [Chitinivibrionales bacterium]
MNRMFTEALGCGIFLVLCVCSGTRPSNLGMQSGKLAPCPQSPNCVSTFASDKTHAIKPLTYTGTNVEAKQKLIRVIDSLPRTRIISDTGNYLDVEFTSFLWRFVDDVEFVLDDSTKTIQFRSASRLGYGDMGVNRKRMETIRAKFDLSK